MGWWGGWRRLSVGEVDFTALIICSATDCGPRAVYHPAPPPPRAPLCTGFMDLMLVLDASGSISSQVPAIREFGRSIVSQLEFGFSSAHMGIVEFESDATLLSPLTADAVALELAIANYQSGGATNIGAGIEMAVQSLQGESSRAGASKIMLVLSDGVQSESFGGDKAAIRSASEAKAAGVRLFSIGFGGVEVCVPSPLRLHSHDMCCASSATRVPPPPRSNRRST